MSYFLYLPQSALGGIKVNESIGLFGSSSTSDPVHRSLFIADTSLNSKFTSTPGRTASASDSSAPPLCTVDVPKTSTPSIPICTDGSINVSTSTSAADASYTFDVTGGTIGRSTMRIFPGTSSNSNSGFDAVNDKLAPQTAQLLAGSQAHGGKSLRSYNGPLDILENHSGFDDCGIQ